MAHLIGISLTITTTAWVAHLLIDIVAWQGLVGLNVWVHHPLRRLWLGVALTLVGILASFALAGRTRAAAEAVAPYTAAPETRGGVDDDERVFNPAFFAHEPDLAFLSVVHQLAALGTLAATTMLALHRAGTQPVPVPGVPNPSGWGMSSAPSAPSNGRGWRYWRSSGWNDRGCWLAGGGSRVRRWPWAWLCSCPTPVGPASSW